jgi:hypothetical protein
MILIEHHFMKETSRNEIRHDTGFDGRDAREPPF